MVNSCIFYLYVLLRPDMTMVVCCCRLTWGGRGPSQQGGATGQSLLTAAWRARGTGAKPGSRRAGPEQTPLTALPVPASTARCAGGTGKGEAAGGGARGVVAVWGRDGRGRAPNDEERWETRSTSPAMEISRLR